MATRIKFLVRFVPFGFCSQRLIAAFAISVWLCTMAARRVRRRVEPDAPLEREHEDFDEYSELASHLLMKWAWGQTPATEVQTCCNAAVRDRCGVAIHVHIAS